MSGNRSKSAFFGRWWVSLSADFRKKGASSTNHCWCQKTRVVAVSCCIHNVSFSFVTIHVSDGQTDERTDGRTDRIQTAIPCVALHAVAQ